MNASMAKSNQLAASAIAGPIDIPKPRDHSAS